MAVGVPAPLDVDAALAGFHPATRRWFVESFGAPTLPQARAWPLVQRHDSVLVFAQTGSGKTLAAFLAVVDRLVQDALASVPSPAEPPAGTKVVYVSPLKALATDVERNLRAPLAGIGRCLALLGLPPRLPTVAVRTGDTDARERARFRRHPADILITTPESLALLLTSQASRALASVQTVIVDEIHALVPTKRGAHLALTLERLHELVQRHRADHAGPDTAAGSRAPHSLQRIGLSATQRPLDEVARFLGGVDVAAGRSRPVAIVDARTDKSLELAVVHALPAPAADASAPWLETLATGASSSSSPSSSSASSSTSKMTMTSPAALLPSPTLLVGAPTGTWAVVPPRITALARRHKTLLVFVNARRLAERLAATVNDLWLAEETAAGRAPDGPLAVAHHGSLARPQRQQIEEAVKRGDVRVLVATSSMELGVDLPSVDVVVQIDAPPSVAAGLQRVGRAGHQVGATSRGVFVPRFPLDVLVTAAVIPAMRDGAVEATRVVDNPVDVLAQQLVGIVALAPRAPDELYTLAKGAAPWARLPRSLFDAVVGMLCGRDVVQLGLEGHDGLRGRLRLDERSGLLVPLAGAHRVAVQNVGTIPDRGLYGVHLVGNGEDEPGPKVGELDEELVFESRPGEVVRLGSSSWRIERITPDRVLVTPAPGLPGKLPFWRGEQQLRPLELGRCVGALARQLGDAPADAARRLLQERHGLDEEAATALVAFLQRQRLHDGGVLPTDREIVIERSRDELSDWQVVVLSPLGGAVWQPLALAIARNARETLGLELAVTVTNDGALFRFPESDAPPDLRALLPRASEVEAAVVGALGDTPLFAARFREAAARALVLPRGSLHRRAALWKQRQRARALFDAVRERPDFPLILEAAREVLHDQFDLPGLTGLLESVEQGAIRVVTVDVDQPSPLAADVIHAMARTSLYDDDVPAAERKARALSLDLGQLRGMLGEGALRELLDLDVIEGVEAILARTAPSTWCRHADDVHDALIRLGALTLNELAARVRPDARLSPSTALPATRPAVAMAPGDGRQGDDDDARRARLAGLLVDELVDQQRALLVRVAGRARVIAVEDAGRYAQALGVVVPPGVPAHHLVVEGDPLVALVRRDVRAHALSTAAEVAARVGVAVDVAAGALDALVRRGQLERGAFRPGGVELDYTTAETLQALRRRTLAALRHEAAPVDQATFVAARLRAAGVVPVRPAAQTLVRAPALVPTAADLDRLRDALARVQGLPLPWSVVERTVLPARVPDLRPAHLDALLAAGEVVWVGDGARGERDGDVRLFLADAVGALWSPPEAEAPGTTTMSTTTTSTTTTSTTATPATLTPTVTTPTTTTEGSAAATLDEAVLRALQARGASFLAAIVATVAATATTTPAAGARGGGGVGDGAVGRVATVPSFAAWRAARHQHRPGPALVSEDVEAALWRLVWRGLVTNDGVGALRARAGRGGDGRRRRAPVLRGRADVGLAGRFTLTTTLRSGRPPPSPLERAVFVAEQLLWACGVLDNELVTLLSRGLAPAADVKAALRAMEDQGLIRRGYFVDGAAGLQYGTPEAVEALRAQRAAGADEDAVFVLAAVDPAQPFGADVPWPAPTSPRGPDVAAPQRAAHAIAVIAAGRLVGLVTAHGKKLLTFLPDTEPDRRRLAAALARGLAHLAVTRLRDGRGARLVIADVDGLDATGDDFAAHPLHTALGPAGFAKTAGGFVWLLPPQGTDRGGPSTTTPGAGAPSSPGPLHAADADGAVDDGALDDAALDDGAFDGGGGLFDGDDDDDGFDVV
ncbi:MAG: DEAD/DEAH box helicase [Deltaproteobacteria bacterium]|nr:DEAD/DEAH box helicase [Deltaproteobacteria bacterium]